MRSLPATWHCNAPSPWTAFAQPPRLCWRARKIGGRGGPTRCCISGPPTRRSRRVRQNWNIAMRLQLEHRDSPIGTMLLVTDASGALRALDFADFEPRLQRLLRLQYGAACPERGAAPRAVTRALDRYFDGDLNALATIPVATGGTSFQREVWAALREIPAGTTSSYGKLAARLGRPAASRAVGLANGAKPIV